MLRAPIKVAIVGACAAGLLGAAPNTDYSVRVHGSQLSNPGRTTYLSGSRVGPAEITATAGCQPGSKVTRMRISSPDRSTAWKRPTVLANPWRARAEFDNVTLASGDALRLACPPGRSSVKTVTLPYTVEWTCGRAPKVHSKRSGTSFHLHCYQETAKTEAEAVKFRHSCPHGFVIKGTRSRFVEITDGWDKPRVCVKLGG